MTSTLQKIIEDLGFKKVDNTYAATFLSNFTGNVVEIIVDDLTDDPDDSVVLRFHAYNEVGDLLSSQTLAQMIVACDKELKLIDGKWDEEYLVRFTVDVEIPIKFKELDEKSRKLLLCDYADNPEKLAKMLAVDKLEEKIASTTMQAVEYEFKETKKVISNS